MASGNCLWLNKNRPTGRICDEYDGEIGVALDEPDWTESLSGRGVVHQGDCFARKPHRWVGEEVFVDPVANRQQRVLRFVLRCVR